MADRLRWGIMATGGIARQFANGLKISKTGELVAVGSRSHEGAAKFTAEFGGRPHGSYEDLLADPEVDAVYIATPHHMHMENTIAAARAGKGILCEKPFTLNAYEAEQALAAVNEAGVFFMEAFMYRCAPQTRKVLEWVRSGAIGRVLQVNSEFAFHAGKDWANFRADGDVGGGGLMDVGSYCVSFTRLVVGEEPTTCHFVADWMDRNYDGSSAGLMKFPGGAVAHFGTGVHVNTRNDARIYGESGQIYVDDPWKCASGSIQLHRYGHEPEVLQLNLTNDELYALEADTVAEYFETKSSPYMTQADTLGQMRTLDALRASANFTFKAERRPESQ
ncbi:MAG: Gfo/Idh/MocA family oxidoreductase [Fimbriimonadaceae bacterium]|nr:Gfo/Idh/MocA family oxidoreductase [Fimbriimonadaceae bacterium]